MGTVIVRTAERRLEAVDRLLGQSPQPFGDHHYTVRDLALSTSGLLAAVKRYEGADRENVICVAGQIAAGIVAGFPGIGACNSEGQDCTQEVAEAAVRIARAIISETDREPTS